MTVIKPEARVEIQLWDWLKTKSLFVKEVYFNRKNLINAPVFVVRGELREKPDLLIKLDRGYGIEYAAVEVKEASEGRKVRDGNKIFEYAENYNSKKTTYLVDEEEVVIKYFLLATEHSPAGHLFELLSEGNIITGKNWTADQKMEPKYEYMTSRDHVRTIFARFRKLRAIRKKNKLSDDYPALGILTSNLSAEGDCDGTPYLFVMNYNKHLPKPKWGCRFGQM